MRVAAILIAWSFLALIGGLVCMYEASQERAELDYRAKKIAEQQQAIADRDRLIEDMGQG